MDSKGNKFWSGNKLFPHSLRFDPNDETAVSFVETAAVLHAQTLQIPIQYSREGLIKIATSIEFSDGSSGYSEIISRHEIYQWEEEELPAPETIVGVRSQPLEFEKDDDGNQHIDFIAACANLRAKKYQLSLLMIVVMELLR